MAKPSPGDPVPFHANLYPGGGGSEEEKQGKC